MENEKTVIIVRHGQRGDVVHPDLRKDYPSPLDPGLTSLGQYQAERTKLLINCFTPPGSTLKVISSPFLGCIETAKALSNNFLVDWGFADLISILNYPMDISESITCKSQWFQERFGNLEILETTHEYPEEYSQMKLRVLQSFHMYLNNLQENAMVIVTHLLPLEVITQTMKQEEIKLTDDGFACVTMAKYSQGTFQVFLTADHTHAPQYSKSS